MLSLAKQCCSISSLLTKQPALITSPFLALQSRSFWRLVDDKTNSDNKLAKHPQSSIEPDDPFDSRQEMFKDGHGVTLFDLKDGERKNLKAVVARFKRLDWGPWIRWEGQVVVLSPVITAYYSDRVVAELKSSGRKVRLSSMKMRSTFFVEFGTIGDLTELLLRK